MSLLTAFMLLCFAGLVATYFANAERDWETDRKIGPRPKMPRKWQPWFVGLCIGLCIGLAAGVIRWFVTGDAGEIIVDAAVGAFVGLLPAIGPRWSWKRRR
jgi:hypothetical protein